LTWYELTGKINTGEKSNTSPGTKDVWFNLRPRKEVRIRPNKTSKPVRIDNNPHNY